MRRFQADLCWRSLRSIRRNNRIGNRRLSVAIPLLTQLNVPLVFHNAAVVPLNSITIDVSGLFDGGLTEMEDTVPADDEEGR
mmetsp:Transcript_11335/g.24765  ORF Transcript_11335/g.24765 Transcript_11335/m.24765 type:complete len:82 (-) Transcript_11335:492-737(-)